MYPSYIVYFGIYNHNLHSVDFTYLYGIIKVYKLRINTLTNLLEFQNLIFFEP